MQINGVKIEDTFAEAFPMYGTRILVTAINEHWAHQCAITATGFATSVIGCGCEGAIEGKALDTPDSRPGYNLLFFTMSKKDMEKQLLNRIGQCIMTAPTSACYNNLAGEKYLEIGNKLRFFGDGYQASKMVGERRVWRVPVMEGEFVMEDKYTICKGVGGGNFLILGENVSVTLRAAEKAVKAINNLPGVILPFPGGVVRSGSKVGSKYKFLTASTNTAYCPSIRGRVSSQLPPDVNCVLEIVIDGLGEQEVAGAMEAGIRAACIQGIKEITAGNYGGNLGKFKFYLHEILG